MINEIFSRSARLLGDDAIESLSRRRVAIFGLGGVGSFVLEALVRAGVGNLILIDADTVEPSNCNRQIIADSSTIGERKVDAAERRARLINPGVGIEKICSFVLPEVSLDFLQNCDYAVDAIDTVTAKVYIAETCERLGVPLIAAMGTGNKFDPSLFLLDDIYNTSVCPLCRIMRKKLRERGVTSLRVVYSKEPPVKSDIDGRTPGSLPFVPGAAGLIIAKEVIMGLIK